MNTYSDNKKKVMPWEVIGGPIGWLEERGMETDIATPISQVATGIWEAVSGLVTENIIVTESKDKSNGNLPSNGSIEFNIKQAEETKKREEVDRKKLFFQGLKEDADRAQRARDKLLLEDEINDIVTNLPTEQKNKLLHYQANYRDRNIYQRAQLRIKLIEDAKKEEKQKKQVTIPSPAKQPNALDTAFEGGSGKSGTGSANFSSTGGGAG